MPSLVIYGAVSGLTQSGSTGRNESRTRPGATRKAGSERRVKENIVRIREHPRGFGLYLFDYRKEHHAQWGCGRQFGVMIDEVEIVMPEALSTHYDGSKRVDYGMLGVSGIPTSRYEQAPQYEPLKLRSSSGIFGNFVAPILSRDAERD